VRRAEDSNRANAFCTVISPTFLAPVQVALTIGAVLMSVWTKLPWSGTLALALFGASAIVAELNSTPGRAWLCKWMVIAASFSTAVALAILLLSGQAKFSFDSYLDQYYAALVWLVAAAIFPATQAVVEARYRAQWKLVFLLFSCFGAMIWLVTAYQHNQIASFYIGVIINVGLLVLWKGWFHLPGWGIQAANTLILILIGFPLADLLFHPAYQLQKHPEVRERLYSYELGHRNPVAYANWWDFYLKEVDSLEKDILMTDPDHQLPYRLRPCTQGTLFQSRISISSLGFRGKEIAKEKGNTYRIVALGESTTFGITLNSEDQPWPELLEALIRQRLNPRRPVEVINAGVPGYTLEDNVLRFTKDILPLHPDLILSYHGINGFPMLDPAIPSNLGPPPPRYKERPVRFLADCEYHLKLQSYRSRQSGHFKLPPASSADPLTSPYAREYRLLIGLARTNHLRLAIGNFSMAVNAGSDPKIIRFYQVSYPWAPLSIEANIAHSRLVDELAEQDPDLCRVDTHPHLDGECQHFLDLVHFSPLGDRQLAENFFKGIHEILETDLR
jgi:lysophospholipase L1-like esterase